ncbi:MAG: tetratricopeptide repeat protein [Gemmataceae bacterium]|nr:tetratricopeptide repeat protein [Gemmataceae bacterium]
MTIPRTLVVPEAAMGAQAPLEPSVAALLGSALQAHQAGDRQRAEQGYRQVLQAAPANADALHMLGVLASQRGQPFIAAGYIQEALRLDPHQSFFHSNLGIALRDQGKMEEAATHFREAVRLKPDYAEAHLNLGNVLRELGKPAEAADHHRSALRFRPGYVKAHYNLGNALLELGKPEEALTHHQEALRLQPDHAKAHFLKGLAAESQRHREEAVALYQQAVRLSPDLDEAHIRLGYLLREQGRLDEAAAHYQQVLRRQPNHASTHFHLGLAFQALGNIRAAVGHFREAVRLRPDLPEAHLNLGNSLAKLEALTDAVVHFQQALSLHPGYAKAHNNLGAALHSLGQTDEAASHLQEALRLSPDYAAAHSNLGSVLVEQGQIERAEQHFRSALRHEPGHLNAHAQLATLLRGRLPDADRAALERVIEGCQSADPERSGLLFALAQVCDANQDYKAAARHLVQANALALEEARKNGLNYDPGQYSNFIDDVIAACTPVWFARTRGMGVATELPIFIVGLPRSGTTLVEQILASHPQVHGAGELPLAHAAIESLPALLGVQGKPWACADRLDHAAVQQMVGNYLDRLQSLGGTAARVVDKMPDNYSALGLLTVLFPSARVIHCRRDLRDVAVSCWMTNFRKVRWANDPGHIAARFADYRRMMEHWGQTLPTLLLEIDYQETVDNLEGVARRLVSWCGLEWDPACLAFHKTARSVRTASAAQVRQPIYRRSLARWRHYEHDLAALFAQLPTA